MTSNPIHILDHILYEDDVVIVLNKPGGLMVEPDRNGHPNLLNQVKAYLKSKLPKGDEVYAQHIHRLDRPVSGVILFAKQRAVLKNLSEQFAERKVKKYYQALTMESPDITAGTLRGWHRKEKKKAVIYAEQIEYSEAISLGYRITPSPTGGFLWDIVLHTGKYHQIRAQLSTLGCPIAGDHIYGSAVPYKEDQIALQASRLVFAHPVTNDEISIDLGQISPLENR